MDEAIIIRYKCCKRIFWACVKGYEDRNSRTEIQKYIREGHTVETVLLEVVHSEGMSECVCAKGEG